MPVASLNCPNCGGAVSSDATQCQYCRARLATISCPSCFGLNFIGSKFCSHCGKGLAVPVTSAGVGGKCPRCEHVMEQKLLCDTAIVECSNCAGLWINSETFEHICAHHEEQSKLLGDLAQVTRVELESAPAYLPCPQCAKLMNRLNFARCSGVIIDLCRPHGLWFDRDELRAIIEFIRSGGMSRARDKERRDADDARRELDSLRQRTPHPLGDAYAPAFHDAELLEAFRLAGSLVRAILR